MTFVDHGTFPRAPTDECGWPWKGAPESFPEFMPDGSLWPKITIVTPSYNQGEFIEETIRSVLMQGYPNLEYIIMDGGSDDQTVEVIRKYKTQISHWESEKDRGQTHAINKGFDMATGEIVAWINSDDSYFQDTLKNVALAFRKHPDVLLLGDVEEFDEHGVIGIQQMHHVDAEHMLKPMGDGWMWHQPGTFVPNALQKQIGALDESLHYAFDKDWMFRLLTHASVAYVGMPLARFRVHAGAKTQSDLDKTIREIYLVNQRHLGLTDSVNGRRLRAIYHLRLAGLYLCEHVVYAPFLNRRRAALELCKTLLIRPATLFGADGLRLLRRLLLPKSCWRAGK